MCGAETRARAAPAHTPLQTAGAGTVQDGIGRQPLPQHTRAPAQDMDVKHAHESVSQREGEKERGRERGR